MLARWAPARFAGNSFHINREAIARELGFSRVTANSLDAVSDRDFALDYLFALAGISTHLSRIAEDFRIVCLAGIWLCRCCPTNFRPAAV